MRIALIGNCQVQPLAVFAGLMLDAADIRVFDYSYPYSRDEAARRAFADSLHDCDWIFTQTATMSFTSEQELRPRYGGKLVTLANFYFRGLFPDSCYIGDFAHRVTEPMSVNSVLVLDAYRRGLSETTAQRQFDIDALHRLGLMDAWSSSMDEMRRREAHGTVDVPAADLMEESCRRYPAFLTMNHPSGPLMADYLHQVLTVAGIAHRQVNALKVPDPLGEYDTTPILDEVAAYLHLPYRVSQLWTTNVIGRRFIGREEFVAASYDAYRRMDPGRLLVHSPTDLVAALRADPARAYLVDPAAPGPAAPQGTADAAISIGAPEIVRYEVIRAIRPMLDPLEEIKIYLHKIHSYLEIVDPKVERLVHVTNPIARIEPALDMLLVRTAPVDSRLRTRVINLVRRVPWARAVWRLIRPPSRP